MATPTPPSHAYEPARAPGPPAGNGIALAGFIVALVGLVLCWVAIVGWAICAVGVILSAIGWSGAKKAGGRNKGLAIAGVICGALGIVIGVLVFVLVMASFTKYVDKAKRGVAQLELRSLERQIKTYHIERGELPPSSTLDLPGPDGAACNEPNRRFPSVPESRWAEDPAWKAIDFQSFGSGHYTFHWVKTSATSGTATAVGDIDCDGTMETATAELTVTAGNLSTVYSSTND
jgi:hypothetical protein